MEWAVTASARTDIHGHRAPADVLGMVDAVAGPGKLTGGGLGFLVLAAVTRIHRLWVEKADGFPSPRVGQDVIVDAEDVGRKHILCAAVEKHRQGLQALC